MAKRVVTTDVAADQTGDAAGDWRSRMLGDLLVAGMAERTQEAYLRAVRQLVEFHAGRSPEELSGRKNSVSSRSRTISCGCGVRSGRRRGR